MREVERRLRVADSIIKYMTIRIDEDLKRLEKVAARRAKRAPKLAAKAAARQAEAQTPGTPEPEAPAPASAGAAEAEVASVTTEPRENPPEAAANE